jgi:hypothetical protein
MSDYKLSSITTETWTATCKICGKPFRSDVQSKAIARVKEHLRDKHGRK